MNITDRRLVRAKVEQEGWTIIWPCAEMPNEFVDEEVLLMYVNFDGCACTCRAIYTYNREDKFKHQPYFKRLDDGSHMVNCLAWRYKPFSTGGI